MTKEFTLRRFSDWEAQDTVGHFPTQEAAVAYVNGRLHPNASYEWWHPLDTPNDTLICTIGDFHAFCLMREH